MGDRALAQRLNVDGYVIWSIAFDPGGQYLPTVMDTGMARDGTIIGCGNGTVTSGSLM